MFEVCFKQITARKNPLNKGVIIEMVAPTGIEPVTQGFSVFFTKRLSIEMRLDLSKIAFISAYFHP